MTDKMTPGMRADVLELLMAYRDLSDGCVISRVSEFREEAARREAEAKPELTPRPPYIGPDKAFKDWHDPSSQGEREGPGSAAAPDDWLAKSIVASVVKDKPTPAADDFAHSLRSVTTVDHRWDAHALSIIRRYENDRHRAADAIDAANAEASSCAAAYKASEARVRELEVKLQGARNDASQWSREYGAEKARADKLADALSLVLPLAKSHVATHDYASSRTYIDMAENELLKGGDRG